MFTDEVREAVSIDSRWRKVPELRDVVCQTAVVRRAEASVQIRRSARNGTQTDPVECRELQAFDGSAEPSIDSPRLARFLRQVEPMVSKELIRNIKSHAFDGFEVNWIDHPNTILLVNLFIILHVWGREFEPGPFGPGRRHWRSLEDEDGSLPLSRAVPVEFGSSVHVQNKGVM
eukprot:g46680.t1